MSRNTALHCPGCFEALPANGIEREHHLLDCLEETKAALGNIEAGPPFRPPEPPERIYLPWHQAVRDAGAYLEDTIVCWSTEETYDDDLEFIRKDLVDEGMAFARDQIRELQKAAAENATDLHEMEVKLREMRLLYENPFK